MRALTVLTHNIFWGLGAPKSFRGQAARVIRYLRPTAQQRHVPHIIEALRRLQPDLIGLQEVDGGSRRNGRISQADRIACALGRQHVFAPEKVRFGLREGNALLTALPVAAATAVRLPSYSEPRIAVVADLEDPPIRVIVTHLTMPPLALDRRRQLACLAGLVGGGDLPTLILGDFNCEPTNRAFDGFLRRTNLKPVSRRPSYPSFSTRWIYDNILVSPHFEVLDAGVVPLWVSDHLPVMARLALDDEVAEVVVPRPLLSPAA